MKRKVAAVLTALVVMAMGSMSVLAASPETDTTPSKPVEGQTATTTVADTKTPDEYVKAVTEVTVDGVKTEVTAVKAETVKAAATAVQNRLNNLEALGTLVGNNAIKEAQKDSKKEVKAEILTAVMLPDSTTGGTVTLKVAGVKAGDTIVVMHEAADGWEAVAPSKVADGEVTVTLSSFSPVSIVKLTVDTVAAGTGTPAEETSPKTGAATPYIVILAAICFAGVVVCGKKVKFN